MSGGSIATGVCLFAVKALSQQCTGRARNQAFTIIPSQDTCTVKMLCRQAYRDIFHASHGLCYDNCALVKMLPLDLRERHHPHPALSLCLAHHLRMTVRMSQPLGAPP